MMLLTYSIPEYPGLTDVVCEISRTSDGLYFNGTDYNAEGVVSTIPMTEQTAGTYAYDFTGGEVDAGYHLKCYDVGGVATPFELDFIYILAIAGGDSDTDPTVPPGDELTMPTYATIEELTAYLDNRGYVPSDNCVGELEDASMLIGSVMRGYDADNAVHVTAASNAVCAQVYTRMHSPMGDEGDMVGAIKSRSANPITTEYATRGNLRLSPLAGDILRNAGLLYGGVRMR